MTIPHHASSIGIAFAPVRLPCRRVFRNAMDFVKLGDSIRVRRKAARLSQARLAESAGISRVSLTRIENATQTPEFDTLARIARALSVTVDELTGDDVSRISGAQVLKILLDSPWGEAVDVTQEERNWLASLPATTWLNTKPKPEVIAEFILARRRL